jgi:DNA-binding beta-propeller fold protein YncE
MLRNLAILQLPPAGLAAIAAVAGLALASLAPSSSAEDRYLAFEARQTHPIERVGDLLLAVNSPAGTLAVYDLSQPWSGGAPHLRWEVPVGVEPVSVRARSASEAWVVNEVSDAVSVVDLDTGLVVATIQAPDEPSDLVFVGDTAVVSCARSNLLRLFDAASREQVGEIPLFGNYPSYLARSASGDRVYVSFLLSGNRTTVLPPDQTPAPPPPTNPALPPAPDTASIVPADDPRISHKVYDHDVAVINTATWQVERYLSDAGTILRALAVDPADGGLFVANMEARNLVLFEPELRGHVADHRLSRYAADGSGPLVFDLNPGLDYATLPNPAALATALAEPAALLFDGPSLWVAAFGSDRIARVDPASGAVLARTDLRAPGEGARHMRGPRGLALDPASDTLYVLNKISNTVSALAIDSGAVLAEFPVGGGDKVPAPVREGRGFLFDTRLSGNGTLSCATCHLDADRDGLAWDLGVPGGEMGMGFGMNLADHETDLLERPFHPMKGPMVTQTLRNLEGGAPFHWRGDMPTLGHFNSTFPNLLGGDPLPGADFDDLEEYLFSLRHHPNPYRNLDNSLPTSLVGGNPVQGEILFNLHENHCAICHEGPRGSGNNIDNPFQTDVRDSVKDAPLQTTYQRFGFSLAPGSVGTLGFGMNRNGTGFQLPEAHFYDISNLNERERLDVSAFVLAFDSGTAAAVGQARTLTVANRSGAALLEELAAFESEAQAGRIDLVAEGLVDGTRVRLAYAPSTGLYGGGAAVPASRSAWLAALGSGEALTFTALLPGQAAYRLP